MESKAVDWEPIDELLFDGQVLPAIEAFRDQTGSDLRDAIDAMGAHIESLKSTRSSEFRVPLEDYGTGIYT